VERALGILNEAIGLELPIVIAPYAKPSLAVHPVLQGILFKVRDVRPSVRRREA
jgi:hypothetical protein